MALVLIDGGEDLVSWGGSLTNSTGRNGNGLNSTASGLGQRFLTATQESDTATMGAAVNVTGFTGAPAILQFTSDTGNTYHILIYVNASGGLTARRGMVGGGDFGSTSPGIITAGLWYYIEAQVKLSDTVGFITVRVNGTVVLSFTNVDTKNAGTKTTFDCLAISGGSAFSGAGNAVTFDDIYLMAGSADIFLGDITVETIYPNGNGVVNQWVGSDSDSINNYLLVNEAGTPVTGTYVGSTTVGQQDLYNFSNLSKTSGTIVGICHAAHMGNSDAVTVRQAMIVNHRIVDTKSAAIVLTNAWVTYHYPLQNDPETSAAWTIANVNALQGGLEVAV